LESSNINPGPRKETFLHNYKELWTNNSLQGYYWNKGNVDNETVTMEKLKDVLKTKMENHRAKIT
jgi:hypothetical protein